eukprot:4288997-Pleurochrysis_carterae.AAC.1
MPLASVTTVTTPSSLLLLRKGRPRCERHPVVGADQVGGHVERLKPFAHRRALRPKRSPVVAPAPAARHSAPRWLGYC